MFFKRDKAGNDRRDINDGARGMTPGIEAQVAKFIQQRRDVNSGRMTADAARREPALQLLTEEDVAYFVQAMEQEEARINAEVDELRKRHLAAIAEKDAQIAAINRDIEATKATIKSQEDEIERRAVLRGKLLETVKAIAPHVNADKLTDDEIRRQVVKGKYGDEAVAGKPQAYVDARFDFLVDSMKVDPFAEVVRDGLAPVLDAKAAADKAYDDYVKSLTESHKTRH